MSRSVEVCLSPALIPHYKLQGKIAVIIDIFRATSSICYGIENGAISITPVATVEECKSFDKQEYLLAAERNGEVVEGFDFGNSPFSYVAEKVSGKKIVLTTTNGTHALTESSAADKIVIGSFLNLESLAVWLGTQSQDVILICAGWKNKFNLEDTLFAGALVKRLEGHFEHHCDAAVAAEDLYETANGNLREYLYKSSHSQRLKELNIEDDIQFCLKKNICKSIPILEGKSLVALT